ncbi:MAG: hypothetical protein K0U20_08775 [Proteobacteria bacterium]|nr:hypothetical protein [Pseudomonadota bacterium]
MSKATHIGTCQCCGNAQKLPNGKLSKHGYTVDYGFFNGTCSGAGQLPFEQSKDIIESLINTTQKKVDELLADAEKWENTNTGPAWRYTFIPASWENGRKSSRKWEQIEIISSKRDFSDYEFFAWIDNPKGVRGVTPGDYSIETLEDTIQHENKKYAASLRKRAAQGTQYIEWQKDRIKNWKPTELTPIK